MGRHENIGSCPIAPLHFELNSGGLSGVECSERNLIEQQQQQQSLHTENIRSHKNLKRSSPRHTSKHEKSEPSNDDYSVKPLLNYEERVANDPARRLLTIGADLSTFIPNYYSSNELLPSFGGAFAEQPLLPHEIEMDVPSEYRVRPQIKLPDVMVEHLPTDTLFFLFYMNCGTMTQMLAATQLFTRGWRFHRHDQMWLKIQTDNKVYAFDPILWCEVLNTNIIVDSEGSQLEQQMPRLSFPMDIL